LSLEKLHTEELHNLFSLPNIIRVPKTRIIGLEGHVAYTRKARNAYTLLIGKPEGRRDLLDVDGIIICRWGLRI
jgi:hypothetical protein